MGYQPGDLKPRWLNFKPVDSLYVIHDFYTNNKGILVADSALMALMQIHINEDGFRSPDLSKLDTTKKRLLFIGDSFTWGMSAKPLQDNCFADLVRNETNFEVINLGIPGADPAQYAALANEYIRALKPDLVFVFFFMGNDLMEEDRIVGPESPVFFDTNAGALLADVDGRHFKTAKEAYDYFVNERYFLHHPVNLLESIISKSALLSRLYSIKFRIAEKLKYERTVKDTHITKKYLNHILSGAASYKIPVKFVLIPESKDANKSLKDYENKFADILCDSSLKSHWLTVKNFKSNFTEYPDAHLNNKGHRLYADSLKVWASALLQVPKGKVSH